MRRKAVLIPILLLPFITINSNRAEILVEKRIKVTKVVEAIPRNIKKLDIENNLIPAMIQVESLGNDSAIGDVHLIGNEAVGALQIRPIMIREVNRILKIQKLKKRFKRKDRYNRTKSIEMFMIWKEYHHPSGGFETIARNWNGGPRGYKNKRTERYWVKVQIELNN
tara:strand:+ start:18 stop:518 length:501 start_codon:yes stop_codon:yes gene_type:complete